jgi:predicted aldo/keto reductase-like oxidoreductase
MEYIVEQQKAGRIRYIGFSAHTEEAALAAMERFRFDSVMLPVGFSSWLKAGFGRAVVAKAETQGSTVVSIKAFCRQRWPKNDPDRKRFPMWYKPVSDRAEAEMALRFALSQGTVRAAIPPANVEVHKLAMDVAAALRPVTDAEVAKLQAIADGVEPLFPQQRRKG